VSGEGMNQGKHIPGPGVTALLKHARLSLLVSLIVLTAGAWGLTLYQALTMSASAGMIDSGSQPSAAMDGMDMGGTADPGFSIVGAVAFIVVWTVMMAAMMLPAAAPMILTFAQAQARRGRAVFIPTWVFIAGYLLVWLVAGLLVYPVVQWGPELASRSNVRGFADWAPFALAGTLIIAGLYQFTPLKRLCLRHCRSPLAFVALHWREGRAGALWMGVRHGLYCLGCCWALFGILGAAGVMNLAWMLLLTLLVFAEKVLPLGQRLSTIIGLALVAGGVAVVAGTLPMSWMAA